MIVKITPYIFLTLFIGCSDLSTDNSSSSNPKVDTLVNSKLLSLGMYTGRIEFYRITKSDTVPLDVFKLDTILEFTSKYENGWCTQEQWVSEKEQGTRTYSYVGTTDTIEIYDYTVIIDSLGSKRLYGKLINSMTPKVSAGSFYGTTINFSYYMSDSSKTICTYKNGWLFHQQDMYSNSLESHDYYYRQIGDSIDYNMTVSHNGNIIAGTVQPSMIPTIEQGKFTGRVGCGTKEPLSPSYIISLATAGSGINFENGWPIVYYDEKGDVTYRFNYKASGNIVKCYDTYRGN